MVIEEFPSEKVWDLCIVGTGPVGMTLALESERLGHEVLMIESGGREPSSETGDASKAHIVDPDRHVPMEIAVCRALGGTSWTWGGRCVAYDDVDWMDRDFVQDAHWPLKHDELRPWYKRATEYMLCGSDQFSIPYNHQLSQGLTFDFVERWAREPKVILEHRDHLYQSARIKLSLSSTLTALNLSSGGDRVESLSVACPVFCISVRVSVAQAFPRETARSR